MCGIKIHNHNHINRPEIMTRDKTALEAGISFIVGHSYVFQEEKKKEQ